MPLKQEPRSLVDLETGAKYELKIDKQIVPGFSKMQKNALYALSKVDWAPTETKLFFLLLGTMDPWNTCSWSMEELATELGISRPAVSKALAGLVHVGLVMRCAWRGKSFDVMLNPRYVSMVDDARQKELLRIFDALALDPRNGGPGEQSQDWEAPGIKETFESNQALSRRRKESKYGKEAVQTAKSSRKGKGKAKDPIPY